MESQQDPAMWALTTSLGANVPRSTPRLATICRTVGFEPGLIQCVPIVQAQYRAALALEMLGRTAEAVQHAERALGSADRGSVGQISALIGRLRRPTSSSPNSSRPGQSGSERLDTLMTDADVSEGRDDGFVWSAAPKLASALTAAS